MYWFVREFELVKNTEIEGERERKIIFQDVFKEDSKEKVKEKIFEKFGKIPMRKTKDIHVGDKYGYIANSSEYWFNYYHKTFSFKCSYCGKEVTVEGEHKYRDLSNKFGHYCSLECKNKHLEEMLKIIHENRPWIEKDEHLAIPKEVDVNLVGYIYRITNKKEHKSYIGKTINAPLFRWWQHLKSDSKKFERVNITDLLFEVLEIVIYDKTLPSDDIYLSEEDKLAKREMFWITHKDTIDPDKGYNKMLEKCKIENFYQLELNLEENDRKKDNE